MQANIYKRYELHNHTTESDASISCRELLDIMIRDRVDAVAITDHNTISGHRIMRRLIVEEHLPIDCIYGMEYTTYYGHILCLNLERYVPWDSIDRNKPELLFAAARRAGALVGIAHPYSFGDPFARGCHFDMQVRDYSSVDFIEIFNDLEPHPVNDRAVALWEELVLSGKKLAATCGMDLHGDWSMAGQYATYAAGTVGSPAKEELARAIRTQATFVSRGLLLTWTWDGSSCRFSLADARKRGLIPETGKCYFVTLTGQQENLHFPLIFGGEDVLIPREKLVGSSVWIPKLYEKKEGKAQTLDDLVCVSPLIYL